MSTLLDQLLVQAAGQGAGQLVGQGLSGAISSAIGSGLSSNMFGGLTFSDPGLQAAVSRGQSMLPSSPPASPPVDQITVHGAAPPPATDATGGALGQVIGNVGTTALAGGEGGDTLQPQAQPQDQGDQNQDQGTYAPPEVGGVNVYAPPPTNTSSLLNLLSGVPGSLGPTVDQTTVTAKKNGLSPTEAAVGAGVLGAGVGLISGGVGTDAPTGGSDAGNDNLTGGGATGVGAGVGAGTGALIGTGLGLGGALLGGSGNNLGSVGDALKNLADNNVALSNRLGNIADAGFAGQIGGAGTNMIARQVRQAQASIRQRYAAMGMSGSSAEAEDLNAASQAGVDETFKIGQQMAQTGLTAIAALTGQSASIYTSLLNAQTAKDTQLGNALTDFTKAAGNFLGNFMQ